MSFQESNRIRGHLCSSSAVTTYVPKGNITFAWPQGKNKLPCIIINQIGGSDIGYLGYKSATAGSRNRKSTETYQIDILSDTSKVDTVFIGDEITPLLMVSGNYRKDSDVDTYDDNLSAYRKVQTFTKNVLNVQD